MAAEQVQIITTGLLSDLIKIGIPSVIALVGTVSSVFLVIKGHKKDIKIEQLRIDNEEEKERNKRKGELIEEITLSITKLQSSFVTYATLLSAKIVTESLSEVFPEKSRKELSQFYQDFIEELHNSVTLEAHVSLLCNKGVQIKCDKYLESLRKTPDKLYLGDPSLPANEVGRKIQSLSERYRAILEHLGKVLLLKEQ